MIYMDYKPIADFYLKTLITAPEFFSDTPCRRLELLYPEFLQKTTAAIADFYTSQPDHIVIFTETYRSNALQLIHYNNGNSKISNNGMHHYGIAVDCAFRINGNFTYKGNYKLLRECFKNAGLYLLGDWDMGHVQYIPATVTQQSALRIEVSELIRKFQRDQGLKADSIVGPKTIAKAKEVYGI